MAIEERRERCEPNNEYYCLTAWETYTLLKGLKVNSIQNGNAFSIQHHLKGMRPQEPHVASFF